LLLLLIKCVFLQQLTIPTTPKWDKAIGGGLKDVVTNTTTGGSGGTCFTLTNGNLAVRKVSVWVGTGGGKWNDRELVTAMSITWTDGSEQGPVGNAVGTQYDFTFHDNETVAGMQLWTGDRVDKISFTTSENRKFEKGGTGGGSHTQVVGNGTLLGFIGTYDSDELVSIGSKFKEDSD
jgi:hypothetical protein